MDKVIYSLLPGLVRVRPSWQGARLLAVLLLSILLGSGFRLSAQSRPAVDSLLARIAKQQVQQTDFFYKGSFPAYRRYGISGRLKADNNIFFTGLIAFTLKRLRPYLSPEQRNQCDTIISRAQGAYPYFRNMQGRPTYNFWRTDPPLVFPNAWFLNLFNAQQALPDDLDDTAILWLSQNPSDSIVLWVKQLMAAHANGGYGQVRNTPKYYRELPAYSTWFGIKMPVDFDFCVLCNVLYFINDYDLPYDRHDSATVEVLRRMITDGAYLNNAAYISPHYGRTPLLLYHVSRLLFDHRIPTLDSLKPRLLQTTYALYHQADNWLDSTLLSTAALQLGGRHLPVSVPDTADLYTSEKTFFVASFSSILPPFWKKILLQRQWIKYYFVCPAYRQLLYVENKILWEQGENRTAMLPPADSFFKLCLQLFALL